MADRNFENQQKTNVPELVTIHARITAAADVDASGYTVTTGSHYISSVTKSAEGIAVVTMKDPYQALEGLSCLLSIDDHTVTVDSTSLNDSTPTINLTFRTGAADADPDSAEIYLTLHLRNSALPNT